MARTQAVHSATSQFYINYTDNIALDHRRKTARDYGYAVFGKVIEGLDVLDAISKVQTGIVDGKSDVPLKPVVIKSVRLKIAAPTDARPVLE